MTVYHLIDALPAAFFGLLGIWAAVVRRHWFLRFSVVCVFLLACLLIPAYEVVIEFGIAIALIMAGVWIARGFRRERLRFSLESALLLMVVVAVVSAVLSNVPEFTQMRWQQLLAIGTSTGLFSLLCLWLVFGKASFFWRLPFSSLGIIAVTAGYYSLVAVMEWQFPPIWNGPVPEHFWGIVTMKHNIEWGRESFLPTMLLGVATGCLALILARGSRWFADVPIGRPPQMDWRVQCSRCGLVVLVLCIFSPLCYLFYRLMTPTLYPVVEMPADNGWDDFVAAGEEMNDSQNAYYPILQTARNGTAAQARAAIAQVLPVLERFELGLNKNKFQIDRGPNAIQRQDEFRLINTILGVCYCQCARLDFTVRFGASREQITELTKTLRFGSLFNRDTGLDWYIGYYAELRARSALNRMIGKFNAVQCQQIVALLYNYDCERGSLENRQYYQRLADENRGWEIHLHLLLQEWSVEGPYAWQSQRLLNNIRYTRMLIAQFALQRYFLDKQRLPEKLGELVPEYLPAILVDPYTNKSLHYQHLWGGYALSIQAEGVGDQTLVTGPAAPYLWQRLQKSWQGFYATFLRLQRGYHPPPQPP